MEADEVPRVAPGAALVVAPVVVLVLLLVKGDELANAAALLDAAPLGAELGLAAVTLLSAIRCEGAAGG